MYDQEKWKDTIRAAKREYYRVHKKKILESQKKHYYNHREKILARNKKYYYSHREEIHVSQKKWWDKEFQRLQMEIDNVFGTVCLICGSSSQLQIHEKNLARESAKSSITAKNYYLSHPENCIRLCLRCHQLLHHLMGIDEISLKKIFDLIQK